MKLMRINVHDIAITTGMLRMVGPEKLYGEIKKQKGILFKRTRSNGFGCEEGRVDYGSFTVDGYKIYFQDCGLFAGDEYIEFTEDTPKELIDKILAILVLTYAKEVKKFRSSQITEGLPKIGNIQIVDPAMFLAKEDGFDKFITEMEKELKEKETKANEVLQGKGSYFDDILKNYKPIPTLATTMLESAIQSLKRKEFAEKKGKELSLSEVEVYLLNEYFEWKSRGGSEDWLFPIFKKRIESDAKPFEPFDREEIFGKEYAEHAKKKRRLADVVLKDDFIMEKIVKLGEDLYPALDSIIKS